MIGIDKPDNCLDGLGCPKCFQNEVLRIEITGTAIVRDNGTDGIEGDTEWEDESFCECVVCGHHGRVKDFRLTEPTTLNLTYTLSAQVMLPKDADPAEYGNALFDCDFIRRILIDALKGDEGNMHLEEVVQGTVAMDAPLLTQSETSHA